MRQSTPSARFLTVVWLLLAATACTAEDPAPTFPDGPVRDDGSVVN
jgi:hypothetical protein